MKIRDTSGLGLPLTPQLLVTGHHLVEMEILPPEATGAIGFQVREQTVELMAILIAGIRSRQQSGRAVALDEVLDQLEATK